MAVVISPFNHTAKLALNKEINLTSLKFELLNASASFNAGHTTKAAVDNTGAYEVYGNGWAQGGEALANAAVTTVDTNDAMLDCDDIVKTASGGSIGPAYAGFIYDTVTSKPLFYVDFGRAYDAGDTTQFKVQINTSGLLRGVF